jgi:ADP-ribose pyrophosphatase YjhB (NUDIX family)
VNNIQNINPELLTKIQGVIAEVTADRVASIEKQRAEGKKLTNNPTAIMTKRPFPYEGQPTRGDHEDEILVINPDRRIQRYRFEHDEVGYLSAWAPWPAYELVQKMLKEAGWNTEEIYAVITHLFPRNHVYGVLTVPFHRTSQGTNVLIGIRGKKLAGTNTGTASFPGGLVKPGERVEDAALRELTEEGVCGKVDIFPAFAFGEHNAAPSITFVRAAHVTSKELRESYEWEGKTMIWVPLSVVAQALNGDNKALVQAFRSQDIEVADTLPIAGDVIEPAKVILDTFIP